MNQSNIKIAVCLQSHGCVCDALQTNKILKEKNIHILPQIKYLHGGLHLQREKLLEYRF